MASQGLNDVNGPYNGGGTLISRDISKQLKLSYQDRHTDTYILVGLYSITSLYFSQGTCVTTSGIPITLDAPFSIRKPEDVNPTVFASTVKTKFRDFLGFTFCQNGETGLYKLASPTGGPLTQPSSSSTSSASVQAFTGGYADDSTSAGPMATFDNKNKIAVSVVVPIVAVVSLLAALLFLRRRRKARSRTEQRKDEPSAPDESEPYLQRKAELEAKDKAEFELEARERRYELDAETMIHEAETENFAQEMAAEDMKDSVPSDSKAGEI